MVLAFAVPRTNGVTVELRPFGPANETKLTELKERTAKNKYFSVSLEVSLCFLFTIESVLPFQK